MVDMQSSSADVPPQRPPDEMREASLLLREILQLTAKFEIDVAHSLAVNRRDFEAMQHLVLNGPLSPSEIARRLGVTTAAATVIVDRLGAAGHAGRQPHPSDRRGILVVPNPDSVAAAMGRILPLASGVNDALDDFSPEAQDAITRYLRRVVDIYHQQLGDDPSE
jgi:DNA-binding MarR family transcriptional regulator